MQGFIFQRPRTPHAVTAGLLPHGAGQKQRQVTQALRRGDAGGPLPPRRAAPRVAERVGHSRVRASLRALRGCGG
jgi:hypothetical protein